MSLSIRKEGVVSECHIPEFHLVQITWRSTHRNKVTAYQLNTTKNAMKLWLNLLLLTALVYAEPSKCPVNCECVVSDTATCTSLDIEPFPTSDVLTLRLKDVDGPIELTGAVFKKLRLTSLRRLIIDNAVISKLDSSAFVSSQIDQLVIRHSRIPKVDRALFKDSKHIRQIDLSYSRIDKFEGIESPIVDEIVLAGCGLSDLPRNAFSNLPALGFLDLQQNDLVNVNITDISAEQINLSQNKITKLTITASDLVEQPLSLNLNNNPLREIVANEQIQIEELRLKSCQLSNLDFLKYFTELTHLDVSDNLLSEIPEKTFADLTYYDLQSLDLSGNNLKSLPANFSNLISLSTLILDRNDFTTLPVFAMKGALDLFSCNDCKLKSLDAQTFSQMRTTKQILLANNHLASLPENIFKPILSLLKVDLSNNALTTIPKNLFVHNTDLKSVSLKQNPIGSIDAALFRNNKMIHNLDVSDCKLDNLWTLESDTKLPSLRELRALNNSIKSVKVAELEVAPKLETLVLIDNKLACNDANTKMVDWLNEKEINFVHNTTCQWNVDYKSVEDDEYPDDLIFDNGNSNVDLTEMAEEESDKTKIDQADDLDDEDESDDDDDDDDEDEEDVVVEKKTTKAQEKNAFIQDTQYVQDIEFTRFNRQRSSKEMLLFLLPTLVFVLTALVVLLLTVSIILCVLQKRNGRRTNAPQINIIPWSSGLKMKKHSGSIYRPLSEEMIPA